jgi:glucoamylase
VIDVWPFNLLYPNSFGETEKSAPGKPGDKPLWTTSQNNGVGTARSQRSHVWFATERGILGEIFYPRVDLPSVKDMGMLVTAGDDFFSEEKCDTDSKASWIKDGVPGVELVNTCKQGRYRITKQIIADPCRHTVLQQTRFEALKGSLGDYHLYVLIAPHLGNHGEDNNARVDSFKGVPMLMAERNGVGLALACSVPWIGRSVGYVGKSDGWQDLHQNKKMTWFYDKAENGNVAMMGEIDISAGTVFTLALGFGTAAPEAAHRARTSLNRGFDEARQLFEKQWTDWQQSLRPMKSASKARSDAYRVSTAVLATHESKDFQGGTVASLSIPWGEVHGDADKGGYHVLWPRDAYETAGALLAAGGRDEITRALDFYQTTQEADGHWPQNMWLDGSMNWTGIQLDETAAPVLLLDLARREKRVTTEEVQRLWPMVRNAAGYIARKGPSSPMDRWEEDAGLTAFTLASIIAALLVAAELADEHGETKLATYFRETADAWNGAIERWTYVEGTPLGEKVGVKGYYFRIAPPKTLEGEPPSTQDIKIPNLPDDSDNTFPAWQIVSVDALALVRFGLRRADDPKMLNTIRVIDAVLKVDTPHGESWHRYNHDGYGEKPDGSPFNKTGIGRIWPLFAGERAHYELAAGKTDEARRLLGVMESLAGDTGLISEQAWDSDPIPDKQLFPGRPSGSARPLVWAHAEHVKLIRSLADGAVFDMPRQTFARYVESKHPASHASWRFDAKVKSIAVGHMLRLETTAATLVRWTSDDWKTSLEADSVDTGIGVFVTDLPVKSLPEGTTITFTFYWPKDDKWEGENFSVRIVSN